MIRTRYRCGHSLIELSVVLSVSSVLMVLAAGWIHQSMKFGSVIRSRQNLHHTLLRLGSQLRDDIQYGRSMAMGDETSLVIRTDDKSKTTYTILPERITRIVTEGEQIVSQEAFPLDPTGETSWDSADLPATVALTVVRGRGLPKTDETSSESKLDVRPIDLHVRASVARFSDSSEATP